MVLLKDPSGIAEGIQTAGTALGSALQQALAQRSKQAQIQSILNPQGAQPQQNMSEDPAFRQSFLDKVVGHEKKTGQKLTDAQLDMAWNASVREGQTKAQPKAGQLPRYTPQQIAQISAINPQMGAFLQKEELARQDLEFKEKQLKSKEDIEERKLKFKKEEATGKRAFDSNKDFLADVHKKRIGMPKREATLMEMSRAIGKKDLRTIRNFAADYLGNKGYAAEYIRTAEANDLVATVKHEFIADTQSLPGGTRLNQYIMRLFMESLQGPLKTPENNLRITEMQRFLVDIDKERIRLTDRITGQYEKAGREPPANLAGKIDKDLVPFTKQKLKQLNKTYRDIDTGKIKASSVLNMEIAKERVENKPPSEGHIWMMSPSGDPKQVPVRDVAKWQRAGGKVIK